MAPTSDWTARIPGRRHVAKPHLRRQRCRLVAISRGDRRRLPHDHQRDRTLAYRRLRLQKLCLDTAIDNISQGLTMFDRSGRLVLCNQRYLEMYGLSANVIRPGCTVDQVVEHRIETGSLTVREAERYVDERQSTLVNGATVSKALELPNGRAIVVTRRPMGEGGWVATHDDITERRNIGLD